MPLSVANKRVTVTGGAGFLGRFVVEKLRQRGAEVFVPLIEDYDLVRPEDIRRMLDAARPEVVVHLAAKVGGIGANMASPATFFYENLLMGVQLVHEAYLRKVEKLVAVGTICAYPKFSPIPFREDDIWNGYPEETNAPFGLAKKMLLVQSQAYRQQYGFNSIVLFPTNLYGPGDNFDPQTSHVVPAIIRKCIEAKEQGRESVVLWGSGSPTREFLYVEDAAEGIVRATERYDHSDPINLGNGFEFAICDLAEMIRGMCGFEGRIEWDRSSPDGQPRRRLEVSRALHWFSFSAGTRLEDGLQRTIDWYLAHREQADAPAALSAEGS